MPDNATSIVLALWGKGGAGKTTTAIALAGLAAVEGRRTVVLDADPQRSASEFHTMSRNPSFNVHSTEVGCGCRALAKATSRYQVVITDNPPAPYRGSHAAGMSLICARPFASDLTLALEWVDSLKHTHAKPLVALTAAPPLRHGLEPPAVRLARERLKAAGAAPWRHQITHRLAYPELIFRGMTVVELPINAPARADYARLWSAICERNNKWH